MSLINSSAIETATEEIEVKCPTLIVQELEINRYNRVIAKTEYFFKRSSSRPNLLLCFTNKDCNSDIVEQYHTQLLPRSSHIIVLKRYVFEDVNKMWTVIFPHSPKLYVGSFTFAKSKSSGFQWEENLHFFDDKFSEFIEIRPYYESFIHKDSQFNIAVILFCNYYNIPNLKDIMENLEAWFPNVGPVWGGTIDSAEVCHDPQFHIPTSTSKANIIQFFICAKSLTVKLLCFDKLCDTKEKIRDYYVYLRKNIKLKENSIAFLCTSMTRYKDFYKIESAMFKDIFPNVTLVQIYSRRPFGAHSIEQFYRYLSNIKPHVANDDSTFLLLTYN